MTDGGISGPALQIPDSIKRMRSVYKPGVDISCFPKSSGALCRVLSVLAVLVVFCGCAVTPPPVPPVTPDPTDRHIQGKFVWFDLFTSDLAATRQFYEAFFGWSFHETVAGEQQVLTITRDGVPIANAVSADRRRIKDGSSRWLSYMSVRDVDQALLRIVRLQGTIYMAARDLPDRGRLAVVEDPEGALFAMLTSAAGDPPDEPYKMNLFMGAEVWARSRPAAVAFYRALAGYDLELVDVGRDEPYPLLVAGNRPRAGVVQIPWDDIAPNWIPYIAVADVDAMAGRVEPLGGRLLIEPDPAIREGNVAIIADPSGAVFAIQQR